jgi:hypothetical protein
MSEVPEPGTPYAHRRGYLYNLQYFVKWGGDKNVSYEDGHLEWVSGVHEFMTPRIPELRTSTSGTWTWGRTWREARGTRRPGCGGRSTSGETSRRLAMVRAEVDPDQVFWSEQSIPPLFLATGLVSDS